MIFPVPFLSRAFISSFVALTQFTSFSASWKDLRIFTKSPIVIKLKCCKERCLEGTDWEIWYLVQDLFPFLKAMGKSSWSGQKYQNYLWCGQLKFFLGPIKFSYLLISQCWLTTLILHWCRRYWFLQNRRKKRDKTRARWLRIRWLGFMWLRMRWLGDKTRNRWLENRWRNSGSNSRLLLSPKGWG